MTVQTVTKLLPTGHRNRPGHPMTPQGLLFHTTNNWDPGASDEMHGDYMRDQTDRAVSWHYTVDCDSRTQHIPENENAWHAGDGENGRYNRNWLGMEICCNHVKTGQPIDRETYDNAVASAADICSRHGFGLDQLQPHNVVYGKDCPHHTLFDRDQFKKDVLKAMGKSYCPQIKKERIRAVNGQLQYIPIETEAQRATAYKIPATDVRYVVFETGKVKYDFVYEKGATVTQLVRKYGADYAFNGPFFNPDTDEPLGDIEDFGKLFPNGGAYGKLLKWHEFGVLNGRPQVGQLDKNSADWDLLVQGTPMLLEGGRAVYNMYAAIEETAADIRSLRAQRTFVGVTAKGDLILAVADGRTQWDQGLSLEEMALFMLDKGAVNALNLDGGTSSVIATQAKGSEGQNQGAGERAVSHAILVYVLDDPATPALPPPTGPEPQEKDWKQQGLEWLQAELGVSKDWKPTDVIEIGALGEILRRLNDHMKGV